MTGFGIQMGIMYFDFLTGCSSTMTVKKERSKKSHFQFFKKNIFRDEDNMNIPDGDLEICKKVFKR